MVYGKEIKSYFFVNNKEYDVKIHIEIQGNDQEFLGKLMESFCFDISFKDYEIVGDAPKPNTNYLERNLYLKKTV